MDITLHPHGARGKINDMIASKSLAHRAFICAALCDEPTQIHCNSSSEDICATVGVLTSLGAAIEKDGDIYTVTPIKKLPEGDVTLDFGESGSTLRFMLPVLGALGVNASLITHARLTTRPLSPLYELLVQSGMVLGEQGKSPMKCGGKLCGNAFSIAGNVSSQFVSGLMLALGILGGGSVTVEGKLESASYVDLTSDMMRTFGMKVTKSENTFSVSGKFTSPRAVRVEGDWSNAAFWLCMGALSNEGVTVSPLNAKSIQGDRKILEILEKFGAEVTLKEDAVTVKNKRLTAVKVDASHIPDLVPTLSVVASCAEGATVIENIARLRFKESDRVETICEMLKNIGIRTESDQNTLTVYGGKIIGGCVDSHNDHRIAMAAAVASCASRGDIVIKDAGAVKKSYPDFFERLEEITK